MIAPVEAVSESGPFLGLYRVDDFADSCIRTSTKSKFLDARAARLRKSAVDSSEAICRHLACNLNCYSGIDRSYPIGRFTHDLFGRLPWRLLRAGGDARRTCQPQVGCSNRGQPPERFVVWLSVARLLP
jgi:hypothetical protein